MADRSTNPNVVYTQDILYAVYRSSRWLNLINRTWEEAFRRAKRLSIPVLTDNIASDAPADTEALEAALALTTATIAPKTFDRGFVRRGGQWNIEDEMETGGGAELQMQLNERIGIELALDIDAAIQGVVAGATYDSVDGSGNDNALTVGVAGNTNSFFVPPAFPWNPTVAGSSAGMDMGKAIADVLLNAKALMWDKDVIDNVTVGMGAPTAELVYMAPAGITLNLVRYLKEHGDLLTRDSFPAQAALEGGIASNMFFEGRWAGIDIVTDKAIPKATNSVAWNSYVVPSGSAAVTGAALPPRISDTHYDQGTTQGAAIGQRWAYCKWAATVLRPEHVVRVQVLQK